MDSFFFRGGGSGGIETQTGGHIVVPQNQSKHWVQAIVAVDCGDMTFDRRFGQPIQRQGGHLLGLFGWAYGQTREMERERKRETNCINLKIRKLIEV